MRIIDTGIGDVTGPASAVDNAIARFNGTTGKILQDYTSGAPTITDTGGMIVSAHSAVGPTATIDQVFDPFAAGLTASNILSLAETVTALPALRLFNGVQSFVTLDLSGNAGAGSLASAIKSAIYVPASSSATHAAISPSFLFGVYNGTGNIGITYGHNTEQYFNGVSGTITSAYGLSAYLENDGGQTLTNVYGVYTGFGNFGLGTIGTYYGFKAASPENSGGGTLGVNYAFYASNQIAADVPLSYAFWSDSPGVFRIKDDGVMAYYNPAFSPKYTPGGVDYERIVQQWVGNVATYGTEAGGTGTLRAVNLIGSTIQANGVPVLTSVTAHDILSATHGDTLAAAVVRGSLIVGNATPKWSALAIGAAATILSSDGTDATWVAATGTGSPVRATSPTLVTPTLGVASATKVLLADGTQGAPSLAFTSDPDTGLFWVQASQAAFTSDGLQVWGWGSTGLRLVSTSVVGWTNGGVSNGTDVALRRDATNILALRQDTESMKFRIYNTFTTVTTAGEWWKEDWKTTANQFRFGTVRGTSTGTARVATWDYGGLEASPTAAITVPITSGNIVLGGGLTIAAAILLTSVTTLTDGAAAALGTLTNAPVAGNPTKWIPISDNGVTRYLPAW